MPVAPAEHIADDAEQGGERRQQHSGLDDVHSRLHLVWKSADR